MSSGEIRFANNYRDLCVQSGTGSGYQFEFYCYRCGDTWRSRFEPFKAGRASGWLGQAGSFAGNVLGNAGYDLGRAAESVATAGWGVGRDKAFAAAIDAATENFNRCARCADYVCDRCFDEAAGLCLICTPDTAAEVAAARHSGMVDAARDRAREAGMAAAGRLDVSSERQLVCPSCATEAKGGKFCPECGTALGVASGCSGCGADLPPGARFCPECGQRS